MGGTTLEPTAMPPLPLSHTQSGHTDSAVASHSTLSNRRDTAFESRRETPTMTAMTKPAQEATVPLTALTIVPVKVNTAEAVSLTKDESKPLKKHHSKRKKKRNSPSELTPLIVKGSTTNSTPSSGEEVYPLPWFRSPEWTRKSPLLNTSDKRRKPSNRFRRGHTSSEQTSLCNTIMNKICCGLAASDTDADLELGTVHSEREDLESEGFKQCVQFLVGLIVVVAAVLIVMIIFQPFQQDMSL